MKARVFTSASISRTKLERVREEMAAIGARSARLRQRAARLQEEKQRESMGREVRRDKERLREKELIAKTVPEPITKN